MGLRSALRSWQSRAVSERVLRRLDEVLVADVGHHWVVYTKPVLIALLGLAAFGGAAFAGTGSSVLSVLGLLLLAWSAYACLRESADRLILTNMRVLRIQGVFSRSVATMPIGKVLDTTVTRPPLGLLLGYGHFVFENAAQDQGMRELHFLPHPKQLDLTIQELVHRSSAGYGAAAGPQGS
ncbi:hypothetical protein GCM10011519_32480 [Marmoricola endophyticus]|uniref:YdbS-like PH domain-containing protein n=1 Tax=Marmoricola endophyticus TaxID=2040280 RepID=A0A917BTD6_9ACTN|nr:PH domain-containing protein [Marmoricola endophyticus]GGF56046.1 hypothetical protein GCM10011519_32480 [Marmoricola endophyticus]